MVLRVDSIGLAKALYSIENYPILVLCSEDHPRDMVIDYKGLRFSVRDILCDFIAPVNRIICYKLNENNEYVETDCDKVLSDRNTILFDYIDNLQLYVDLDKVEIDDKMIHYMIVSYEKYDKYRCLCSPKLVCLCKDFIKAGKCKCGLLRRKT